MPGGIFKISPGFFVMVITVGVAAHPVNPGYNINDESLIIFGKVISCSAKSLASVNKYTGEKM